MTRRGLILRDTNIGAGVLTVEGTQYTFVLEGMWLSEVPPRVGMAVEVSFNEQGAPETVRATPEILTLPAERSADDDRSVPRIDHPRLGLAFLLAEVVMLLAFFLLPGVSLEILQASYSGWDLVRSHARAGGDAHGLLGLLAIVCLSAPLAAGFLPRVWVRVLCAAPLAFVAMAAFTVSRHLQLATHQVGGDLLGGVAEGELSHPVTGAFRLGLGSSLVALCAVYLASRGFKSSG